MSWICYNGVAVGVFQCCPNVTYIASKQSFMSIIKFLVLNLRKGSVMCAFSQLSGG